MIFYEVFLIAWPDLTHDVGPLGPAKSIDTIALNLVSFNQDLFHRHFLGNNNYYVFTVCYDAWLYEY